MMITLENFSPQKRDRKIGDSLYRICNTDPEKAHGKWYIHEMFNNDSDFVMSNGFYSWSLQKTIDRLNGFTREKEVINP